MTNEVKVKLNLDSGETQERTLITAFKYADVKYLIFDGESTGSMGLPVILVCKEQLGKVVGITEAEEWKNTKECLKKIISGDTVEYINVSNEYRADSIYYRQLTLPVSSFDLLKQNYKAPELPEQFNNPIDNTPVFEQINPEEITNSDISAVNPVPVDSFTNQNQIDESVVSEDAVTSAVDSVNVAPVEPATSIDVNVNTIEPVKVEENVEPSENSELSKPAVNTSSHDEIKAEFMKYADKLFELIYDKINHND